MIEANPNIASKVDFKLENKETPRKSPLNKAISLHGIFEPKRKSELVTFKKSQPKSPVVQPSKITQLPSEGGEKFVYWAGQRFGLEAADVGGCPMASSSNLKKIVDKRNSQLTLNFARKKDSYNRYVEGSFNNGVIPDPTTKQ